MKTTILAALAALSFGIGAAWAQGVPQGYHQPAYGSQGFGQHSMAGNQAAGSQAAGTASSAKGG